MAGAWLQAFKDLETQLEESLETTNRCWWEVFGATGAPLTTDHRRMLDHFGSATREDLVELTYHWMHHFDEDPYDTDLLELYFNLAIEYANARIRRAA